MARPSSAVRYDPRPPRAASGLKRSFWMPAIAAASRSPSVAFEVAMPLPPSLPVPPCASWRSPAVDSRSRHMGRQRLPQHRRDRIDPGRVGMDAHRLDTDRNIDAVHRCHRALLDRAERALGGSGRVVGLVLARDDEVAVPVVFQIGIELGPPGQAAPRGRRCRAWCRPVRSKAHRRPPPHRPQPRRSVRTSRSCRRARRAA